MLHFDVKCKLTTLKVISARRNVFQVQKHIAHPTKLQKIAEIKNIPYFLPVVYMGEEMQVQVTIQQFYKFSLKQPIN